MLPQTKTFRRMRTRFDKISYTDPKFASIRRPIPMYRRPNPRTPRPELEGRQDRHKDDKFYFRTTRPADPWTRQDRPLGTRISGTSRQVLRLVSETVFVEP